MDFNTFLQDNNVVIVDRWIDRVLATYAPESKRIFKRAEDQFANPVGFHVAQRLRDFFRIFCEEEDPAAGAAALEQLIRIRAVQDFTPAEAVSFIFELKGIVAEEYRKVGGFDPEVWLGFAQRVDTVALMIFDMYLANRERLYQVRIAELKSGRSILTDNATCPSALMRREQRKQDIPS
nr:RsbRD N-terminal domain-containing protein [Desulfobacteraceae bacterium]